MNYMYILLPLLACSSSDVSKEMWPKLRDLL